MASKQWQLANNAAERYQEILVPSILGPFAESLVKWANLDNEKVVVDIGCGTGAATRFAATALGADAQIIATDVNTAMLNVARSLSPVTGASITWQQESAEALSMEDDSIDVVLCAQTLQFLSNRAQALREMHRILKHGKSAYISLWCNIEQNPYFNSLVNIIAEHIGEETAAGLRSAFNLSDADEIYNSVCAVGFSDVQITVSEIVLDLPPLPAFVPQHIQATPMGAGYIAASSETRQDIQEQMLEQLQDYVTNLGTSIPFRSYLIQATK